MLIEEHQPGPRAWRGPSHRTFPLLLKALTTRTQGWARTDLVTASGRPATKGAGSRPRPLWSGSPFLTRAQLPSEYVQKPVRAWRRRWYEMEWLGEFREDVPGEIPQRASGAPLAWAGRGSGRVSIWLLAQSVVSGKPWGRALWVLVYPMKV